jgi:hypothetical protein
MTKYELVEKTEINGQVWYKIVKNGAYVSDSYTQDYKEAIRLLDQLVIGKPSEPIIKVLKTIEIDEERKD